MANSMQTPPYLRLIQGSPSSTSTSQSTSQTTINPTEAPTVTVDPGQVIRINARFPGQPDSVQFSLLPPTSDEAIYDPGVHEDGSFIQQDGDLFYYVIDTSNMRGGVGWWYFCSKDTDPEKRRAKVGKFIVRDVPTALYANGETLLGGDTKPTKMVWPWIVGSGVGGAALGTVLGYALSRKTVEIAAEPTVDQLVDAIAAPMLRDESGRFLSTVVEPVTETAEEAGEDTTEDSGSGTAVLVTLGVVGLGALGYWLWRRHQAAKIADEPKKLTAHVGEEECGFDLLGAAE